LGNQCRDRETSVGFDTCVEVIDTGVGMDTPVDVIHRTVALMTAATESGMDLVFTAGVDLGG